MSKSYVKDASGKWRLTDKQEMPVVTINQQRLLSLEELEKLRYQQSI
jgi:hypothetical protein